MTKSQQKAAAITLCCVAAVAGLAAFDFACSMWIRPLGLALGGLEIAATGLFIGRSLGDN